VGAMFFFCFGRVGPRGSGIYPKMLEPDTLSTDDGAGLLRLQARWPRLKRPPYLQHIQSITSVHPRNNKA